METITLTKEMLKNIKYEVDIDVDSLHLIVPCDCGDINCTGEKILPPSE